MSPMPSPRRGPGRPPLAERVERVELRLPADLADELREKVPALGRSAFVREAITEKLRSVEDPGGDE
jgi:metal-responsive CopG/Arc/MetJ family transcriptional regulator